MSVCVCVKENNAVRSSSLGHTWVILILGRIALFADKNLDIDHTSRIITLVRGYFGDLLVIIVLSFIIGDVVVLFNV